MYPSFNIDVSLFLLLIHCCLASNCLVEKQTDILEYKVKQFPKCFVNSKNKSNFAAQKNASK